jgi:phytoene dehydrogenase-like protein
MSKIAIIGGGIGGLAAGCYARMNGLESVILEKASRLGGLCTSWDKGDYIFDGCIRHLAGLKPGTPLNNMWKDIRAMPSDIYFPEELVKAVDEKGNELTVFYDLEKLEAEMKRISPEDSKPIEDYIRAIRRLSNTDLMEVGFWSFRDWLRNISVLIKNRKVSKYSMLSFAQRFKSPVLRAFFPVIQYGWANIPLTLNLGVMAGSAGKRYGRYLGGSAEFIKSVADRYTSLGGEILYNSAVERVIEDSGKVVGVRLENGTEISANYVISDAYGYDTFMKMIDERHLTDRLRSMYSKPIDRMMMALHVSFGVNMDLSDKPNAISFFLDEPIEIAGDNCSIINVLNYSYDKKLAPKGKTSIKVMYDTYYSYWEELSKDQKKYEEEKAIIASRTIEAIERFIPGIGEAVEVTDVATPITIQRFTSNARGYGSKEDFRLRDTLKGFLNKPMTLKSLKNFFVIGHSIGGTNLYGCAAMGRNTIKGICKKERRNFTAS